jgi:hypothetical protein
MQLLPLFAAAAYCYCLLLLLLDIELYSHVGAIRSLG